jgi:hypothetical protein
LRHLLSDLGFWVRVCEWGCLKAGHGVAVLNRVALRDVTFTRPNCLHVFPLEIHCLSANSITNLQTPQASISMPGEAVDKRAAAREVIDILDEISTLLVR